MREGIYGRIQMVKMVLTALSLRKGNEFRSPIISRPQRGVKSSPVRSIFENGRKKDV
ncbi:MAG: hypothetical protein WBN94_02560 [Methanothrix sp.]